MEHRWSTRKPVVGNAVVECPRVGRVPVVIRDVSLGGMWVETAGTVLPVNTPVMVGFSLPVHEREGGYHLHAMIVRHAPGGAGLMFLDLGTGTVRSLCDVLYGTATAQAGGPQAAAPKEQLAASGAEFLRY